MTQVYASAGQTLVALECAQGTRVIVVLREGWLEEGETADTVVHLVDDWASRKGCPCCGGCLTLAAVDVEPVREEVATPVLAPCSGRVAHVWTVWDVRCVAPGCDADDITCKRCGLCQECAGTGHVKIV